MEKAGNLSGQASTWIADLGSEESLKRICARVNLLRNFPEKSVDYKPAQKLHSDLTRDVRSNPNTALEVIASTQDLQEQAYMAMALNSGFYPAFEDKPDERTRREQVRKKYIETIEPLEQRFSELESNTSKVHIAEIIAKEGSLSLAIPSLETIWDMGWDVWIHAPVYDLGSLKSGYTKIVDSLADITRSAQHPEVRKRGLEYISQISDNEKRRELLKEMIQGKDQEIAVMAVDKYLGDEADVCHAINLIYLESINPAAIDRAFDRILEAQLESNRLIEVFRFVHPDDMERWRAGVPMLGDHRGYAKLVGKSRGYLAQHIEDVDALEPDAGRDKLLESCNVRTNALFELACHSQDPKIRIKAIDYLARKEREGVKIIARIFSTPKYLMTGMIHEHEWKRVEGYAIGYTRDYREMEDKDLARKVLQVLASEFSNAFLYDEKDSGKNYQTVAKEELALLPPLSLIPTEEEQLAQIFMD
ncbi:hypothetical protein J4463_04200 [Candidatus Pacearchaeota archaeon]|nr:hypothetical protein [Candidatus Pacearchaeota archaeon]